MNVTLPGIRPIAPLLRDPSITEIMINGPRALYIERGGKLEELAPVYRSDEQLEVLVENLLMGTGRHVSAASPFVDFRLPDGSRVNVVLPPIALDGVAVTIRKFTRTLSTIEDLIRISTLSERMGIFLCSAIGAKLNLLFTGATGAGKTTTLGLLSAHIPETERIITIEDTAELQLRQRHVVRLECRPPNIEGVGVIDLGSLLRNSLRMRPHRIIVGEIRSDEAVDMLHAMTTGHDGCLAVLHASSPADAISRLEMLVMSRGLGMPLFAIRSQIGSAIDLVIQHRLMPDGSRKITNITEVRAVDSERIELRDLFTYEIERFTDAGIVGKFRCSGEPPGFLSKFADADIKLDRHLLAAGAEQA